MMNLPPEIIEIIFLKLCPPKTTFPLRGDPRLLVTQVCFRWRAIALAMPSLWANIRICVNPPPRHDHIHAWISRSAQSPLSVGFYGHIHPKISTVDIFNFIAPAIHRCVSLKICIDESTLKRLLALPPGSLGALQNISIRSNPIRYSRGVGLLPRVTAFQQCPRLRQVTFAFKADSLDPTDFNLPWHQLTHLNMSLFPLRYYGCLSVLRQCVALQECSISITPFSLQDLKKVRELSRSPVMLPSLHTFHLDLDRPVNHNVDFVHALRLPRLRSLRPIPSMWPCALLPIFRTLLSETIRHLDLSEWIPTDLPGALALVPNLEMLKLQDGNLDVLQTLGSGVVVPRLVTLMLDTVHSCDLFDMLEARVAAARADSSIALFSDVSAIDSGAGDIDTARLGALRAAGVQVVFRNRSL